MNIMKKIGTIWFFILFSIWFPLALFHSFIKDEIADKKLRDYLAYLNKDELFMDTRQELQLCKICLEYVSRYLIISEGRGPDYIRFGEVILYKRKNELEAKQ